MGKLHEVLAVEPELRTRANQEGARVKRLFEQGKSNFVGQVRKYHSLDEGGERLPDEMKKLGTDVFKELLSLKTALSAYIDASIQKEVTNTHTTADVVVDGRTIFHDLPAPALLNLEAKLAELRKLYAQVPVLDPTEQWDYSEDVGYYVSRERVQYRTKKVPRTLIKAEATEHHPAQVEVWMEDVQVGTWTTTIFSGAVTIKQKTQWLRRIDSLGQAVKQARQRANNIDVINVHVAERMFEFIEGVE